MAAHAKMRATKEHVLSVLPSVNNGTQCTVHMVCNLEYYCVTCRSGLGVEAWGGRPRCTGLGEGAGLGVQARGCSSGGRVQVWGCMSRGESAGLGVQVWGEGAGLASGGGGRVQVWGCRSGDAGLGGRVQVWGCRPGDAGLGGRVQAWGAALGGRVQAWGCSPSGGSA